MLRLLMRVVVFDDVLCRRQPEFAEFAEQGMVLHFYAHADDAVDVVESERPDLVLMDYAMEEHLTGVEAVQNLRVRFPVGELRIVGISSDAGANQRMVAVGADEATLKPHLRGYLRAIMRRRAERQAGRTR